MGGDSSKSGALPEGMYDAVVTRSLLERLTAEHLARHVEGLDDADQPAVLARHVARAIERALDVRRGEGKRVALVNRILDWLRQKRMNCPAPPNGCCPTSRHPVQGGQSSTQGGR